MNFEELQSLVALGESEELELKASTGQIDAGNKSLCSFLNTGGGRVLFGVLNDGGIEGQDVSDGTQQTIAQKLGKLEPASSHELEFIPVPGSNRLVIMLTVRPSPELVPYTYDGRPYERVGTTTQVMSQQRYQELLIARTQSVVRWETGIAQGLNISVLDEEEIIRTARIGIKAGRLPEATEMNSKDILSRLGLITSGAITNAAAVLFGKELVAHFPQCILRAARFKGVNKNEFMDNKQISGHAFLILEEAMLFLRRHLPIAGKIQPGLFEREDEPLFPVEALREALVNAVCHRDYSIPGGAISLAIFDDRLEIWSDGTLPLGISIDDLKKEHSSRPRNPLIAQALYRRGLVESWGRGTQRIVELCTQAGHPEPEFIEQSGSVGVRFLPRGYIAPHRVEHDLTENQRLILQELSEGNSLPLRELREVLTSTPEWALKEDLYHLRRLGLIKLDGHGRGAVWSLLHMPE